MIIQAISYGEPPAQEFAFTYSGDFTDNRVDGVGTVRLNTSGTLTVTGESKTVSAYLQAGGGGGAQMYRSGVEYHGASGGGGGYQTVEVTLEPGTYEIVIGAGGTAANATNANSIGGTGGDTSAFDYTCTGGIGGRVYSNYTRVAGTGGSPGGGNGNASWNTSSLSVAGGSPNGGRVSGKTGYAGGDGYVNLTFS